MARAKKVVMKKAARTTPAKVGPADGPDLGRSVEVERWIRREVQEQERLYRRIVRDMNALNDRRIKWVKEFYERLQTRGFSVHAGLRRKIRPEEIPPVPRRIRAVF